MSNQFYPRKRAISGRDLVLLRVYRDVPNTPERAEGMRSLNITLVGGKHDKKKVSWIVGTPQTWEPFEDGERYTLDEDGYFALVEID